MRRLLESENTRILLGVLVCLVLAGSLWPGFRRSGQKNLYAHQARASLGGRLDIWLAGTADLI